MNQKGWFRNAVIYQVFIDRFSGFENTDNSLEFAGGNLPGVTTRLDYLHRLGINVIWLSPFYETTAYHGYHITDFMRVDPRFGEEADLLELIREARKLGIRVIADFVPNHCSSMHPYFLEARADKGSRYTDWFIFERWPDQYRCFMEFRELPKLNLENREARDYMTGVADHWLSMGLDGFRIDHVIGPSHRFWKEFRRIVTSRHPESILIGEAWAQGLQIKHFKTTGIRKKISRKIFGISQERIQLEYVGELDGVLDFELTRIITDGVRDGRQLLTDRDVRRRIEAHFKKVPADYHMVTFLDNHDMDRFIRHCGGDVKKLLSAFELLLSLDHPVVIYNGTENCMSNEAPVTALEPYADLQVRNPMDWEQINHEFVEGFQNLVKRYRGTG